MRQLNKRNGQLVTIGRAKMHVAMIQGAVPPECDRKCHYRVKKFNIGRRRTMFNNEN